MKIISCDGSANHLKVLNDDGTPTNFGASFITKIAFKEIVPGGMIEATLTLERVAIDFKGVTVIEAVKA